MKKLIIFGDTVVAKLAHFYFMRDSDFEVVAFTVDRDYLANPEFCGLPVVEFESLSEAFSPDEYSLFIAMGPTAMNQIRAGKVSEAKSKGYSLASYISPHAVCHSNIGDNCLVADNAVINPFSKIGDNNFFWEFSLICNDLEIGDHCYFSPRSVISSYSKIEDSCVVGTGSIIKAHANLARGTLVGARCYITRDTEGNSVFGERNSEFLGCVSEKVNISL